MSKNLTSYPKAQLSGNAVSAIRKVNGPGRDFPNVPTKEVLGRLVQTTLKELQGSFFFFLPVPYKCMKNKRTFPSVPLWEEIFEKVAREYVKDLSEIIPKVEVEGKNDDTYLKINKLSKKYRDEEIWMMPHRLRTRFWKIVSLRMVWVDDGMETRWKVGKEYHKIIKKLSRR